MSILFSIFLFICLVLGVIAFYKWFRNSLKKHTFLWVVGIIVVLLIVVF